jgi:hypothetical protein
VVSDHSSSSSRLGATVPARIHFSSAILTVLALENAMTYEGDPQAKTQPGASDSETTAGGAAVSSIEQKLLKVAEELGAWLGAAERKTTDFIAQQNIQDHLVKIRDTAARLLAQVEKGRERSR